MVFVMRGTGCQSWEKPLSGGRASLSEMNHALLALLWPLNEWVDSCGDRAARCITDALRPLAKACLQRCSSFSRALRG